MLVLEQVEPRGSDVAVTLHGDIPYSVYPKTELTQLIDHLLKVHGTAKVSKTLGIKMLEAHRLRNGSHRCDLEEVKRLLREGGLYGKDDP